MEGNVATGRRGFHCIPGGASCHPNRVGLWTRLTVRPLRYDSRRRLFRYNLYGHATRERDRETLELQLVPGIPTQRAGHHVPTLLPGQRRRLRKSGSSGFRCSRRLGFSPTSLKPRPRRAKAHPTIHRDPHLSPEDCGKKRLGHAACSARPKRRQAAALQDSVWVFDVAFATQPYGRRAPLIPPTGPPAASGRGRRE